MAHFLLVHGSAHGAWCWRDLTPRLKALGHTVDTLDLPGSGDDQTRPGAVTLATYADAILARLDAPTILLGHSAGGFAITEAAERDPHNIARLVYLCAYVPVPGRGLADMRKAAPSQPLTGALEVASDGQAFRFREAALAQNLYPDCPPEVIDYARPRLGWQPIQPQQTPVSFTDKSADTPKSYILCSKDRTIPPAQQRGMTAGFAPEDIHEIATGHSPFFAHPTGLAQLLDTIASA